MARSAKNPGGAFSRSAASLSGGVHRRHAILTVIWAFWHLPLWFIPGAEVPKPFLIYVLGVAAITLVMTWFTSCANGSVLLAMLFHASLNLVFVRGGPVCGPAQ